MIDVFLLYYSLYEVANSSQLMVNARGGCENVKGRGSQYEPFLGNTAFLLPAIKLLLYKIIWYFSPACILF